MTSNWNKNDVDGTSMTPNEMAERVFTYDEYISFKKTNHKNPYKCPIMLEVEDIFGKKLTYDRPFSKGDIRYLIRKKKYLHNNKCRECYRLPENRTQQPMFVRPNITTKHLDIESSKKEGCAVTFETYSKGFLTCDDCRVMKLKQSINREIKGDCGISCLVGSWPRRTRV